MDHIIQKCSPRPQYHLLEEAKYTLRFLACMPSPCIAVYGALPLPTCCVFEPGEKEEEMENFARGFFESKDSAAAREAIKFGDQ